MTLGGFGDPQVVREFEVFVDGLIPDDETLMGCAAITEVLRKVKEWLDARGVPPEQVQSFVSTLLVPFERSRADMPDAERERWYREWAGAFGMDVMRFKDLIH